MNRDSYGRVILSSDDLVDLLYQNPDMDFDGAAVIDPVPYNAAVDADWLPWPKLAQQTENLGMTIQEFDRQNQGQWYMPKEYRELDILELITSKCETDAQTQRVAEELMLYHERGLFDLLRYLKYLVDVLDQEGVICGLGRGSSVSSYVLFLLGVHAIDSLHWDLDVSEFLKPINENT